MDPYFAEFMPLEENQEPAAHMHAGFEFLYLLEGELEVRHGEQHCVLGPGDAAYFDSSTRHSYQCAGSKPAQAMIVTMRQPPPAMPMPQRAMSAAAGASEQKKL